MSKQPLFVKAAWLNLFLVVVWILIAAFDGSFTIAFVYRLALAILLLLVADWAHHIKENQ